MNRHAAVAILISVMFLGAGEASPDREDGFGLSVVIDGKVRQEFVHRGTTYVEARNGVDYVLRLSNTTGRRIAVALSVDGLNTIDARHGEARRAAKWVIGPWETVEIAGWQVSGTEARRFYFTSERDSYGALLGETDNLGVIEAVVFREKARVIPVIGRDMRVKEDRRADGAEARESSQPPAPMPSLGSTAKPQELAATGIGDRVDHPVEWMSLELEERPASVVRIRYEFRPQLERLGVLPPREACPELDRRERAHGFDSRFCPDPGR